MVEIPQPVRELVDTGRLAHVVTLAPDGTPHVSLAWAGFVGDELIFATFYDTDQHKLRNLRRDPRVSLSFEAKEHTGDGLHPYVVIRGRATITEGGALEVMDRLAGAYIEPAQPSRCAMSLQAWSSMCRSRRSTVRGPGSPRPLRTTHHWSISRTSFVVVFQFRIVTF